MQSPFKISDLFTFGTATYHWNLKWIVSIMHCRHCRSIRALIVAFDTHINDKDYFHIKETNANIIVKLVKVIKQVRYYLCIYTYRQ